jgi:hypothetical protein
MNRVVSEGWGVRLDAVLELVTERLSASKEREPFAEINIP